jgi:hypothetical protein
MARAVGRQLRVGGGGMVRMVLRGDGRDGGSHGQYGGDGELDVDPHCKTLSCGCIQPMRGC